MIVSLQPILASVLAISLFSERLRMQQIAGIAIGLLGVVLVLWPKLGGSMPVLGLISVTIGLAAVTGGTLLQKKIGKQIGLLPGNIIQTVAASLFFIVICSTVETPRISWEIPFIIALAWQIVLVSAGAYLILMVLIQRDSMAATSSLMFLVPPVTAVIAAIGFNEPLTLFSLTGFAVTSTGVYLVTRYKSARYRKPDDQSDWRPQGSLPQRRRARYWVNSWLARSSQLNGPLLPSGDCAPRYMPSTTCLSSICT